MRDNASAGARLYAKRTAVVYRKHIPPELAMADKLLLKFRSKDSPYGVTRKTLRALSKEMDMSETMVVHLAVSRFAREVLPRYPADERALSASDLAWIRRTARPQLPKGKVIRSKSLL